MGTCCATAMQNDECHLAPPQCATDCQPSPGSGQLCVSPLTDVQPRTRNPLSRNVLGASTTNSRDELIQGSPTSYAASSMHRRAHGAMPAAQMRSLSDAFGSTGVLTMGFDQPLGEALSARRLMFGSRHWASDLTVTDAASSYLDLLTVDDVAAPCLAFNLACLEPHRDAFGGEEGVPEEEAPTTRDPLNDSHIASLDAVFLAPVAGPVDMRNDVRLMREPNRTNIAASQSNENVSQLMSR